MTEKLDALPPPQARTPLTQLIEKWRKDAANSKRHLEQESDIVRGTELETNWRDLENCADEVEEALAEPVCTRNAKEWLASRGLADLSLYWPTNKPIPKIDYASGEAPPTLTQLMEKFAAGAESAPQEAGTLAQKLLDLLVRIDKVTELRKLAERGVPLEETKK